MKPMLFNTEMVCALLDNRKTATRRVIKPQPKLISAQDGFGPLLQIKGKSAWFKNDPNHVAPYQSGDILYVRETWQHLYMPDRVYIYKADSNGREDLATNWKGEWKPSIHMPKKAARIFLRVTDVRAERLQDVNDEQAQKEGCNGRFIGTGEAMGSGWAVSPTEEFAELWDNTIKPTDRALYGWDANPWVWVIEFERISREEALASEQLDQC